MKRALIFILFILGLGFCETNVLPDGVPDQDACITGECVPHYQCKNNEFVTDGSGIISVRFSADTPRVCHNYLETCCDEKDKKSKVIVAESIFDGCGRGSLSNVTLRLEGDKYADYGEFPWMAAISQAWNINSQQSFTYRCGGSLIHPSVVLTAAHCVKNKPVDSLLIRLGEWDTQTENEIYSHQDRSVVNVVIHPQFDKYSLQNDIALLFLNETVELQNHIQTICLPPQDFIFDDNRCITSGWGKHKYGLAGNYQVILKKLELPIISRETCQMQLQNTRLGLQFALHESFLCAGGETDKDVCRGDGGSPLVCAINGTNKRFYQSGIVAWGIGCGGTHIPGVYVNIARFINWIDEIFTEYNLDKTYYKH